MSKNEQFISRILNDSSMFKIDLLGKLYIDSLKQTILGKNPYFDSKFTINTTGTLLNSLTYKVYKGGVINFYAERYIGAINNGVRAGVWVPTEPIKQWVADKGLVNKWGGNHTQDSVTAIVKRKIYKEGIKPKPLYDSAEKLMLDKIKQMKIKFVDKNLTDKIKQGFSDLIKETIKNDS